MLQALREASALFFQNPGRFQHLVIAFDVGFCEYGNVRQLACFVLIKVKGRSVALRELL